MQPAKLKIKLFLDGADLAAMRDALKKTPPIQGFTTNPSLMRKSGVSDYAAFAREALGIVGDKPISFEVFSDDFASMEREARIITAWGGGTYVKIPVTNTKGESSAPLIRKLSSEGIKLNVTAIFTVAQVKIVAAALDPGTPSIVSVFAGRIADTGIDPEPIMTESVAVLKARPKAELLWASSREFLNIFQADKCGCHIITAPSDVLSKLALVGKSLDEYSLDTVKAFYSDAKSAGFKLGD